MRQIIRIFFLILSTFFLWSNTEGQIRINEIRADDASSDDAEFIELIGITGADISGYEIVHVNGSGGSNIFSHTIGTFTISNDGLTDSNTNNLGFYVLGLSDFASGADESISNSLQNGPDGIILYDSEGNVIDAVAWQEAGDINGDVTTSGSPEAQNYLHITSDDDSGDNSLQAPDDVIGDDGTGWTLAVATIGAKNSGQTSGSIIIESSVKAEPANHVTSFTASGAVGSADLSWTDATGSPTPDAYLIKASNSGFAAISNPTDTTPEPNDTDLSDGTGVLNINHGIESAGFSELDGTTTYYFKIYPYANTGSDIDYKTDGPVPQDDATTLETPDIVLNEILSDPDGDANGDGTIDSGEDEFLEFVNTGDTSLDISNWTIEDENTTTHTFSNSTVLQPHQAIVIFGDGTPTGDFGSSRTQTADGLSLNNGGDDVILKNASDVEIINFTYSGASNQSETRNPDLTGSFENHTTADTDDGSAFSPGTRIDGTTFQPSITFNNGEGWRMISAPTFENSYNALLDEIWTQCSLNSDYNGSLCSSNPDTEPNVLIYNGSGFTNAGDLDDAGSNSMAPGTGFIVYVYSDDNFDAAGDTGFPKTLDLFGAHNSGNINPPLNSGSGSWTLVGNPYTKPIDWDELDRLDLEGTIYVYDFDYGSIDGGGNDVAETRNDVGGGYRTWNGSAGSLADGKIAPFQGFWVRSTVADPNLTFEESAQTTGGTFYTKEHEHSISIRLKSEMNHMYSEAFLSFTETGRIGKDTFDGLKLSPLDHRDYMSLSTEVDGIQTDINNLPKDLNHSIEIPLSVQAFEATESGWAQKGGKVTLRWPELNNFPADWEITLTDTKLDRTISLNETDKYIFEEKGDRKKISVEKPFDLLNPQPLQKEKAVSDARFFITINPNVPDSPIDNDIPNQFTLQQNYPNPFNPRTTIKYKIAEPGDVTLGVFNVMGQRVTTLVNEAKVPGTYEVGWDAQKMASGIYYYRLKAGGVVVNRQMTLIK